MTKMFSKRVISDTKDIYKNKQDETISKFSIEKFLLRHETQIFSNLSKMFSGPFSKNVTTHLNKLIINSNGGILKLYEYNGIKIKIIMIKTHAE